MQLFWLTVEMSLCYFEKKLNFLWRLVKMLIVLLVTILVFSHLSYATTYYVRPDGGTAVQCSGLVDAPYPGTGTNQPCAWSHPFWALTVQNGQAEWKIQPGDTLLIYPGSYMMGYGAPNTEGWCDQWGAYDCHLPPLPSGPDPEHPTRILGVGWDSGCPNPPELWGTERAWQIIDLTNTSNAVIACLEITDHAGCAEFHANSQVRCERDNPPYGNWASIGIYAENSSNVTLKYLNIHGLATSGINAGRLYNWTIEDVRIAGNGWCGWDGDLPLYEDDSNGGTITFRRVTIEWNGCVETYPQKQPDHCWAQSAGGYGDGLAGSGGGGHWIIEDSLIQYNTSDGIDLLYVGIDHPDSQIEIKRTIARGNAGNQLKVGGAATIVNSLVVGNCGYFYGKSFAQEMGDKYSGDQCRAGGAAISLNPGQGDEVAVINSTVASEGWALIEIACHTMSFPDQPPCNGTESVSLYNNVFVGYAYFLREDGTLTHFIGDGDPEGFTTASGVDYNLIYNAQVLSPVGPHTILNTDPLLTSLELENFDAYPQASSPVIDVGLGVGEAGGLIPDHDLIGTSRPQGRGVDLGAYEYSSAPPNSPPVISSFTADPSSGNAPLKVNFTCHASDPDGEIVSYEIDFGEGQRQTNSSGNFVYTYFKAGTYEVTCWAEDNSGAKASQTIHLNLPKQAAPNGQVFIDDTATYQSDHAWVDVGDELINGVFPSTATIDFCINLPSFEVPMDVYIGVSTPDMKLYVLNADNQFVLPTDFSPPPAYRIGITEAVKETVLKNLPLCCSGNNVIPAGEYEVYVLAVPTNGGHFEQIDFTTDAYYLYYYSFRVPTCF